MLPMIRLIMALTKMKSITKLLSLNISTLSIHILNQLVLGTEVLPPMSP